MKEIDWQLLSWLVCPFLDIGYLIKTNEQHLLHIFPIFLFHCFGQVSTNFTFTSETSLILILLNCLPSNATKNSLVKFREHKLEESFSDGIRDVQLGRFILLSVPISQQLPRLTSLSFFSFLNCPLKHDCNFRWQQTGGFEQLTTLESWKYSLASTKLQSSLQAIFTLVLYPFLFVASLECTDSTTVTGMNTYCSTF